MTDARQQAAQHCLLLAQELEIAAAHLRTAAQHIEGGQVPRYAAHLLATRGHLVHVGAVLDDLAVTHAARSLPNAGEGEPT